MRPTLIALITASLTFAPTPRGRADEQPPADKSAKPATTTPAETVYAVRQLAIPALGIAGLERLSPMVELAAERHAGMIGVSPAKATQFTRLEQSAGPGNVVLSVRLDPARFPPEKRRADEFLRKVTESLEEQLRDQYVQDAGLPRAEDEVQRLKHSVDLLRHEIARTEEQIRQTTGRADASVEAIRGSTPKLDDERLSLKLQLVGKQARQQALASAIDRLSKAAAERAKDDPVAAELEKVVRAREKSVERAKMLQKQASISLAEVDEAETAVAEARAKMLERRDVVSQANGGDLLTALNRELAMVSIDVAEAEAKVAETERLLKGYVEVQDMLSQADDLRRERARAEAAFEAAKGKLADARRSVPEPVLRVIKSVAAGPNDPAVTGQRTPDAPPPDAGSPPKP